MKKVSLMLVLLAIFASVIVFAKNKDNTQDPNSNSISENSIINSNSTTSKIESESKDTESNGNEIVEPEHVVDYTGTSFEDWVYSKDDMPEPFNTISDMNNIEYGTAGSSFKKACATVDMLVLSNNEDTISYVEEFMKDMTPIQKDYFSMNWEFIMTEANEAFDDSGETLKLTITGFSDPEDVYDLDISLYSKEKLTELDKKVNDLFRKYNVTKEWKNYPEMMFN